MEAEPPGHAFPGGAWEREVWRDFFLIPRFETASGGRYQYSSVPGLYH
jgi:hypothetical protein